MKNKKRIYDRHELLDLVNKEHSCIILKHCNRKIELQAKYLKAVKAGIKEALDATLNKFDYSLNGILLDYRHLKILADNLCGRIVGRCGEFIVTVNAEFFVFDPKIGSLLEGVVNAKSDTHVGCLVHKCFNAMILKPDVDDKWNCENIQIGDKIIFTIVDYVFRTNIPHIEGVLATEYIEKSLKNSKKKSKVSGNSSQEIGKNCNFPNEVTVLAESSKKTNKVDDVDSHTLSSKKHDENDLTDISGNKPQKTKGKKRKIDPMQAVVDNMMDTEESLFQEKKKKKKKTKEKEKSDTILKTETPNESSMPVENPASVFRESLSPTHDNHAKQKKKKRDKEKEVINVEPIIEPKQKKKKDKKKDAVTKETAIDLEIVEEKLSQNVEESVPKKKKKNKHEKECPPNVQTTVKPVLSQSNKNKLCIDDNQEINISPVDLIDQLMNVVPTDLISSSKGTPVKKTSPEGVKSSLNYRRNETPEKSQSPGKKKREESTYKATGVGVEGSPTKKRHLVEPSKSTTLPLSTGVNVERSPTKKRHSEESSRLQDKSLFSDSEESVQSPSKPKPVEDGDGPIVSTQVLPVKSNHINKKEKKRKKGENTDENQTKKKEDTVKMGAEPGSSIIKSSINKLDKKNSRNKSVTWENDNLPAATGTSILLKNFEKALAETPVKVMDAVPAKATVKKATNKGVTEMKETTAAKGKKKAEAKKQAEVNSRLSLPEVPHTKSLILEGIDDTQLNNPVKTSTPKVLNNTDNPGGKVKKPRTKKAKEPSGGITDTERASIINALLEQAKQSLGIGNSVQVSPKKNKNVNSSI